MTPNTNSSLLFSIPHLYHPSSCNRFVLWTSLADRDNRGYLVGFSHGGQAYWLSTMENWSFWLLQGFYQCLFHLPLSLAYEKCLKFLIRCETIHYSMRFRFQILLVWYCSWICLIDQWIWSVFTATPKHTWDESVLPAVVVIDNDETTDVGAFHAAREPRPIIYRFLLGSFLGLERIKKYSFG